MNQQQVVAASDFFNKIRPKRMFPFSGLAGGAFEVAPEFRTSRVVGRSLLNYIQATRRIDALFTAVSLGQLKIMSAIETCRTAISEVLKDRTGVGMYLEAFDEGLSADAIDGAAPMQELLAADSGGCGAANRPAKATRTSRASSGTSSTSSRSRTSLAVRNAWKELSIG